MRKLLTAIAALAFALTAAVLWAHHGPTQVTLDTGDKRPPVVFEHTKHVERVAACDTCHHTNKGLTAAADKEVKTCASCHVNPEKAGTPDATEMSMTKNPFHILCVGCHKEEAKGPTKCADCHK
ncbi:MAG TPA: cytochrome c3 family protein [Thermoanaerobaculia bacterium]|nr:cytochrome c3 family protein [Thermoanaerobaculia bacterium]